MYGEGGTNGTSEYRFVNLSEFSNCCCIESKDYKDKPSSRRKQAKCEPLSLNLADMHTYVSARKILLNQKPTLIDNLIYLNKVALMGPKKKPVSEKRKRASSPETNVKKAKVEDNKKRGKNNRNDSPTRKYVTRISTNKVKIPFSLRSGRKMVDILKHRNRYKNFAQLGPPTRKRNVENTNTVKEQAEPKTQQNDDKIVRKRKKRKKCSMAWLNAKKTRKRSVPIEDKSETEIEKEKEIEITQTPETETNEQIELNKTAQECTAIEETTKDVETIVPNLELEPSIELEPPKVLDKKEKTPEKYEETISITEKCDELVTTPKDFEELVTAPEKREEIITTPEKCEEIVTTPEKCENELVTPVKCQIEVVATPEKLEDVEFTITPIKFDDSNSSLSNETNCETDIKITNAFTLIGHDDIFEEPKVKLVKDTQVADSTSDVENQMVYISEDDVEDVEQPVLPDSTKLSESAQELRQITDDSSNDSCMDDKIKQDSCEAIQEIKAENINAEILVSESILDGKNSEIKQSENLSVEQTQSKVSVLEALGLKSLSSQPLVEEKPKRQDGYTGTLKAVIKIRDKNSMKNTAKTGTLEYRICSDIKSNEQEQNLESDSNIDYSPSSSPCQDDDQSEKASNNLVIPEKSSSFSIHPGRLCSDICAYCHNKFGSLDTPCHIKQLKGHERQKKILDNEPLLSSESCLCDACYRYVDRRANFPSKIHSNGSARQPQICSVNGCVEKAMKTMKRKWLLKLKKTINNKLDIDLDKPAHGVYYPLCNEHHDWVEYFTVCGICRKRLNRNNLFSLGPEADRLNLMLAEDNIPARLADNMFLCKLCRYYSDLRLKYPNPDTIPAPNKAFYKDYRKKILISLQVAVSDSEEESDTLTRKEPNKNGDANQIANANSKGLSLDSLATLLGEAPGSIQVKFGNVNIGTLSNLNIGQQGETRKEKPPTDIYTSGPSLTAQLEYQGNDGSWEKYCSTLMFDRQTKQLWTELQRPYGNQSSFLRHLVMLEKVWRSGFLTLNPNCDERAAKYITSAKNRILAFEGVTPAAAITESLSNAKTIHTPPPLPLPPPPQSLPPSPKTIIKPKIETPKPVAVPRPKPMHSLLEKTGEVELTTIKLKPQASLMSNPQPSQSKPSTSYSYQQQQFQTMQQIQQNHQKKLSPLDRAKSLVVIAQTNTPNYPQYQQRQQYMPQFAYQQIRPKPPPPPTPPAPRFNVIPPLLKIPSQYQQQPNKNTMLKLPKNLTVVSIPKGITAPNIRTPAITLRNSGITIEKQSTPPRYQPIPAEKPSISVFREPNLR